MKNASFFVFSPLFFIVAQQALIAQELNFDEPAVTQKKDSLVPSSVGPVSNIQLGGAVDWRLAFQNGEKKPFAFLHVNEFVVSANVGDHIAISAEQLLLTSEMGSVVGQDHGFVTVQLVQLPFLPNGTSLKLGRFRGKFGSDAQTDSPANVFPSAALRSNGFVTDVGIHLDYAVGLFEFNVETFNGPDYMVNNNQKDAFAGKNWPVQARVLYQPFSSFKLGLSGFRGETWDNQLSPMTLDMGSLGSSLNQSRTIDRMRLAADASIKTPYADFLVEGIWGQDKGRLSQAPDKKQTLARGGLIRTDIPLFKISNETRTKLSVQYDTWKDGSFDGNLGFLSSAFSVSNDDGWTVRLGGTASDVVFKKKKPSYVDKNPISVTSQLLVTF
jgi:hypothetical protein